ncbi:DUF3048 domain-containing protein [Isoptericola sp. AK164]|uniref:DUF3048 domain-containing protein n=1 Tax=Isoptericola sp. AK164 TaxID=3024246 RepID=UPI0024188D51|nr:DUF3048 domain-containing protein [Isoptericola sp. AK164]
MRHGAHGRTTAAVAGLLVFSAGLVGCTGGEPAPAPTTTVAASTGPVAKGLPPDPDVATVWPLTGVETDTVADRPALGVKIENSPQARPQAGLEDADLVWEEVVEGGISRFLAVYHSQIPEAVEPVRSVRPMDPAIVAPLDGILAYSGAQPPFIADVRDSGTQSVIMDAGDPGFRRDPARPAPHDVIGDPETFLAQDDGQRTTPPPQLFRYAPEASRATAAGDASSSVEIDVRLSPAQRTRWAWDAGSGTWLRSEGSSPSMSTSGVQHAATNVVALRVEVVDTPYRDASGAAVPETQLVDSEGVALVASAGGYVAAQWSKGSLSDPIELTRDGEPVELAPGSTWIELVPRDGGSWTAGPPQ